MSIPTHVIAIHKLYVAYQGKPVLHDITAHIPSGVILAVVGPNGAGKSTLLKTMVGLLSPVSGNVKLFGDSYAQQQHRIAYVPQKMAVDWDFPTTVLDVVLMGRYGKLGWFRWPKKEDVDAALFALAYVGMAQYKDRPIGQLSGGQQQRVFLARALVQEADLYLMDEPFVGVDMATKKTMIGLLQQLKDEGKTIVVVNHDMHTVREYFDWVLLLNGTTIACGPTNKVLTCKAIIDTYGHNDIGFSYHDTY